MRRILYNMHFRGRISAAPAEARVLRTTGSATSCVLSTLIGPLGVETDLKPSDGELAFMESEFRVTGPGFFEEGGTICFGEDGHNVLRFSTIGQGHLAPSPDHGILAGTASWRVDGGEGQFAAASGFITSTFTLTDGGELSDFHSGLIFFPD